MTSNLMPGGNAGKTGLLKHLARIDDLAALERILPLLDRELRQNNLDGGLVDKALQQLYARSTDPGLCSRIMRLRNRLRARKILGRDLLQPLDDSAVDGTTLWDELRQLEKVWQQATGQPDFTAKYKILEKIGSGGMSTVFLGLRRHDRQQVAIKFLRRRFFDSERVQQRFRRECEICPGLDHPRIVRFFEAGEHDGGGFLVMEYLPLGGADRLLSDPGFSPAIACRVALQAAEALQVIHDRGIIHRDLKPANLLLAEYQPEKSHVSIKLTDFGVCRQQAAGGLTNTGDSLGTEMYMAPEQLQNAADVDFRADIYSLGALIYRLFSRKYFPVGEYAPLNTLNPDLPAAMNDLVRSCLRHQPEKRPASAAEVRQQLQQMEAATARLRTPFKDIAHENLYMS